MRKRYIDLLRELALFYMIFQHTVLALLKSEYHHGVIKFLFDIVPLDPALFLFVAGFSITLSYNRKKGSSLDFAKHQIKRGVLLILAAALLFFIENGLQPPDIFISPGILNTIGIMIICSAIIINLPYKLLISLILSMLLIVFTLFFEIKDIFFVPFNYGYEPLTPTIIFGFIGLFTGILLEKTNKNKKIVVLIIGVIGLSIFAFYSVKYGLFKIITSEMGRYDVQRNFNEAFLPQNLLHFNEIKGTFAAYVWNYKMNCFFASLGFVLAIFSLTYFLESFLKYLPKYVFFAGQNALFNYFYHLSTIAISIVIFDFNNFSIFSLLALLLFFYSTGYLFPYIITKVRQSLSYK